MVTMLVLYNRPSDPQHFQRHYRETHGPLTLEIPGLREYEIGYPSDPDSPYYAVVRMTWDSEEALAEGLDTDAAREAIADLPNFNTGGNQVVRYEVHTFR